MLHPVLSFQSGTNDIDPAFQELNSVFPTQLLPQDQNENQVAGKPATFDPNFWNEFENHLASCGEPAADDSEFPSLKEEGSSESYLTNGSPSSIFSCLSGLDNIPNEVSAIGGGASNVETEPMDIDASWLLHVDDYLVPPPPQPQQTFSNNFPTPVCAPFSLPVNTDGGVVCTSFSINTDGDVPLVVQVAPIPSRSQSVIKQGPALAARLSTSQAHCRQAMHTSVGSPRDKKVAKTNAERCELYRMRQKSKKEKDEEKLRMLDAKNRELKAKEAAIRNKVQRMKEAVLRMGLGNYIDQNM